MMDSGPRVFGPVLLLALGVGCAPISGPPAPELRPDGLEGVRLHRLGALDFEAPSSWEASGDARRLALVPPEGGARLEAWVGGEPARDDRACLVAAESTLRERDAGLSRVQRHASTLGGRPALAQEADQGTSHGWAYVGCAGGVAHWLTFTGRSPVSRQLLEDWRAVVHGSRLGGSR